MRKISGSPWLHNGARPSVATASALLISLVALAGCGGGGEQPQADQQADASAPIAATRCAMEVSDAGLREFFALGDRIASGERPDLAAMNAAADSPTWQFWRRSFLQETVRAEPIGRAMYIAMLEQEGLPERQRDKTVRLDLVRNFELALARRDEITAAVDRFIADERGCEIRDRLQGYLPQADLPDTLRLVFMVGLPEIRLFEDVFLIDAGLVWASGQDQLVRFLASTLYKQATMVEGRSPTAAQGADVLLHCLRVVRNEGIAAYIDNMSEISFEPRHTILGRSSVKPDELCQQAIRTLRGLDAGLDAVRLAEQPTEEQWQAFYRLFVGAGSWQSTGWYMSQVIVDRFGIARLQEVGRSVPDFFATYQQAARQQKDAPDAPRGALVSFLAAPPTFGDENAAWIDRELRRLLP